jgi:hypothetical protein
MPRHTKRILTTALLFCTLRAFSQCQFLWQSSSTFPDGIGCYRQGTKDVNVVPANCHQQFPKRFLDSILDNVSSEPFIYPRGKEFSGIRSEFRVYRYNNLEIVHCSTNKYLFGTDSISIHDLSFSDSGQWKEDECYHFLYNAQWGIIGRNWFGMDPAGWSYLKSNSCFTETKNKQLEELIGIISHN